jgi:putative flippase GtrA
VFHKTVGGRSLPTWFVLSETRTSPLRRARASLPPSVERFARFAFAGGFVAVVNLGTSALLIALFGVAVQLAVAIAYVIALTTHFTLQRFFVFAGQGGGFALSFGAQLRRYLAVAAVQYPLTAGLVALFTSALGIADLVAVVCAAIVVMPVTFFIMRTRLFHAAAADVDPVAQA